MWKRIKCILSLTVIAVMLFTTASFAVPLRYLYDGGEHTLIQCKNDPIIYYKVDQKNYEINQTQTDETKKSVFS